MNKQLDAIIERLQGAKAMTILTEMFEDGEDPNRHAAVRSQENLLEDAKVLLDELTGDNEQLRVNPKNRK